MSGSFFKVNGTVRENIIHKKGDGWEYTNFLLTAYCGKNKDGKATYNSFPIFCWFDADVKENDEITVIGQLRMQKEQNGKFTVRLVADNDGISYKDKSRFFKNKGNDESKPEQLEKAEQIFAEELGENTEYMDSDIPF